MATGALNVVIEVLFAVPTDGDAFLRIMRVVPFIVGIVTLVVALRGVGI